MIKFPLVALWLSLAIGTWAVSRAAAVTFTNDVTILPADTNYDGQDIIIDNCIALVDGAHNFSSILVTNGGTLTHMLSASGTIPVQRFYVDEAKALTDTNAVALLHSGLLISIDVTDVGKTVTYSNGLDYATTVDVSGSNLLQRVPGTAIPDGA